MTEQLEREALYIHPSENSSLVLSSSPLDGKNFLPWNRSVYVALGTKMKLGFIDGTFSRPTIDSATFEQWRRVDLMVMSWIWNSISKDMVESFMYVSSSRELWLEIQDGRKEQSDKSISRKKPFVDRRRLVCSHCRKPGHTLDSCFQIHGIPEWYKTMHDAKKKGNGNHNFAATVVEEKGNSGDGSPTKNMTELMSDLIKLLKRNNLPADPITTYANFTCHDEENFAGNVPNSPGIDLDY
ncbi:UNVERIFIED_CONTAM: hypothetical protein Sindi_0909000 [Sesamum indicum]